jgi:hypothetical protein
MSAHPITHDKEPRVRIGVVPIFIEATDQADI